MIITFRDQKTIYFKSFSIVRYFHRNRARELLDGDLDITGMRMPGHIRERLLCKAIEGRALGAVELHT